MPQRLYISVLIQPRESTDDMTVIGESTDEVGPTRCQGCSEVSVSDNEDERGIHEVVVAPAKSSDCWPCPRMDVLYGEPDRSSLLDVWTTCASPLPMDASVSVISAG